MPSRMLIGAIVASVALAAVADGHAASNTARYRVAIELRVEATYTKVTDNGRGRQIATYSAKSKRPFTIRRIRRRTGPRFSFIGRVAGEFTWRGSGFGGPSTIKGGCVIQWTESVYPDQTAVSGWVSSDPKRVQPRIGILVTPDASGQVGEIVFDPNADCEREVVPFYASSLNLLILPEQLTEPVPLRQKFGRSFTVRYTPGALRDRPNVVRGDGVREEYDYAWTLRFTRVR